MEISGLNRKGSLIFCTLIVIFFLMASGPALCSSEESGGGITVIPDVSVLIQIANFLLILWALNMILYRPIRSILKQRKEKVAGLESTIATYHRNIQEKDEAFAAGLKAARAKGLKEKEALIQAAGEEEKKIIDRINSQTQAELTRTRERIASDVEVVKASLQKKIDEFAKDISRKILGRAVS
jgi:F-type H+-transporting ATPase subunit b